MSKCKHLHVKSFDSNDGIFCFVCMDCHVEVEPVLNKYDLYEWQRSYLCDYCNQTFQHDPIPYPKPLPHHCRGMFCSDACAADAYDEVITNARADAIEYEMGN